MATIKGETGSKGTQAIATRFPVTEGLVGATTKQTGTTLNLVVQEKSLVSKKDKEGLG